MLKNDYDLEGDAMSVSVTPITSVAHGKVTLTANGNFKYTSDKTFRGIDSLV